MPFRIVSVVNKTTGVIHSAYLPSLHYETQNQAIQFSIKETEMDSFLDFVLRHEQKVISDNDIIKSLFYTPESDKDREKLVKLKEIQKQKIHEEDIDKEIETIERKLENEKTKNLYFHLTDDLCKINGINHNENTNDPRRSVLIKNIVIEFPSIKKFKMKDTDNLALKKTIQFHIKEIERCKQEILFHQNQLQLLQS